MMDEESATYSTGQESRRDRAQRVSECESEYSEDLENEVVGDELVEVGDEEIRPTEEQLQGSQSPEEGRELCQSNEQLEAFRHQWHVELQQGSREESAQPGPTTVKPDQENQTESQDLEDKARAIFLQGMEAEDNGCLTEAIYFYRKALQLVPDIESKLGNMFNSPRDRERQDSESSVEGLDAEVEIVSGMERLKLEEEGLCRMDYEQRMVHISCLPVELVIYILHWVVSNDLDLRSLEMFARVCKGFYMCARDERVWKKACQKVWGLNLGSCKKYSGSWRRMMIDRPHLLYDGCYISKVTYVRQGEQSMDGFYRPFHLVEYFRYIRFFPDGQVLMLVSPDDPLQSLPRLKNRNSRSPGILRGGYRLSEQKVTCLMKRVQTDPIISTFRYKRQQRQANNNQSDMETSYVVEFDVVASGKRQHAQLLWSSYYIENKSKRSGEEVRTKFDLNKRDFPNLVFSRVRSYMSSTTEPLA